MKVNIKTCHVTYGMSHDINSESYNITSRFLKKNQDKKYELWAENGQIFHCLQDSLTNANLASLSFFVLLHLHQVFIYKTYVLSKLWQFWNSF